MNNKNQPIQEPRVGYVWKNVINNPASAFDEEALSARYNLDVNSEIYEPVDEQKSSTKDKDQAKTC